MPRSHSGNTKVHQQQRSEEVDKGLGEDEVQTIRTATTTATTYPVRPYTPLVQLHGEE
jgi:hypothetical protein